MAPGSHNRHLHNPLRWRTRSCGHYQESSPDVLLGAVGRQAHTPRTAADEEVAFAIGLQSFPLEEYGLGAALAAHHAHGLALDDLRLRIDAGAGPVAETVADHLRQVAH